MYWYALIETNITYINDKIVDTDWFDMMFILKNIWKSSTFKSSKFNSKNGKSFEETKQKGS